MKVMRCREIFKLPPPVDLESTDTKLLFRATRTSWPADLASTEYGQWSTSISLRIHGLSRFPNLWDTHTDTAFERVKMGRY